MVDGTLPGERTQPLRPRDPRSLGDYELVGRLGEGGMGTVYLARTAAGVLVAVKMVRADLAHDDEFRRRFRSEVNRARQVPPFCTAEVLDADPDHEHPYLVVEYVDGPTLAEVVEDRGPLTSANLHGVAIGVATALTAIHGAGVIHRDLKPRNVLLAPGSPKVIDFGIARAMEATSANTRTDQMVGTVAYMAPERFSTEGEAPVTPAADVFAWGSVVAYAGTGRTPFHADSPPATAARILTQPPRLDGLSGPLRDLIAHALEKDPANRPTARELLDLLVSSGERPAATAAAFADQPDLKAAAVEAQAVTGVAAAPATATVPGPVLAIPPGLVGYDENSIITVPISEATATALATAGPPRRTGRRWALPAGVAILLVAVVVGAVLLALSMRPPAGGGATPGVSGLPDTTPLIADALRTPSLWVPTEQAGEGATCRFENSLVVRRKTEGTYRCTGPADEVPANLRAQVGVSLLTENSCAAIWFRFKDLRGYLLRVCQNNIYVGKHKRDGSVPVLKTFPLAEPIALKAAPTEISLIVIGETVQVLRGGVLVGSVPLTDPEMLTGRLYLGVFNERNAKKRGPYEVAFTDVRIWSA
ncbi:serine/threonine-protein kinase [Actinoplanes sp. DH11]|uniref:serine/threonine protein kinase n=1 Tax=Actinoplanes sp. DH11 TaxID=2857011 RepID=UPI001E5D7647|nr:serine/threonine-protein kinase [Actinoplanes sp. DH11]